MVDCSRLNKILNYLPEDMTVRVESGINLLALGEVLGKSGQWLPVDPPGSADLTVKEVLDGNLFGPAVAGFGFIREHLIGMKAVLADGRTIESGGNVVKNVAGYDLQKLFIGARQSLGVITEAVFKLAPLPRVRKVMVCACADVSAAASLSGKVRIASVTPDVFDWYRVAEGVDGGGVSIVLRFGGSDGDVSEQVARVRQLGFTEGQSTEYDEHLNLPGSSVYRTTSPPSALAKIVESLNGKPFVARAANGIVYHYEAALASQKKRPLVLEKRIREMFDPAGIMPAPPWLS